MRAIAGLLPLIALALPAAADYALVPKPVAEGVYLFEGQREHFNRDNGGNIVNTGFIQTSAGAVVIDTGPSKRYGEAMRRQIASTTGDRRIAAVFITHAHPDHFLGNQAFADVPVLAAESTRQTIRELGAGFADALYRLVGPLMAGTVPVVPDQTATAGVQRFGEREIEIRLLGGHTHADLVVLDRASGTLFAGDLVFFERALTTPSADIPRWLASLETLQGMAYRQLVPGHGPPVKGPDAIAQTRDYLNWQTSTLQSAARAGLDMPEVLTLTPPARFARLAVFSEEFERSVVHLYPEVEGSFLKPLPGE